MENRVLSKLKKFSSKEYYIVGVSGGCDSMCLLDLLRKSGLKIVICHVNYNLRHDTNEDYKVVSEYANQYHIPLYYKEVTEKSNDNFQQFARHIRYDFYFEIGKKYHTNKVFLGHHKDDVYETILMQKERNHCDMYWGIKDQSFIRGNVVYRILLEFTKKEIIEYCDNHYIYYHDDYTNFETHYKRDYIRNVVLSKMSEDKKKDILKDALIHNEWLDKKNKRTQHWVNRAVINKRLYFKEVPDNVLEDVLKVYLQPYIPIKRISKSLILEIMKVLKKSEANAEITLPVNLRFIKEYDNGYIQTIHQVCDYEYHFNTFYEFECEYFKLLSRGHLNEGVYLKQEDFPITIRNVRAGDCVHTNYGHKKVNRLFIDRKIPIEQRKSWPILLNKDNEILLIPHIVKNLRHMDTKANVFVVK